MNGKMNNDKERKGESMNTEFPRILQMLRSEAKISQKQASKDLRINQALLSHYENGNRECRLEFIMKAADYYKVSTDFLLGRSPSREGKVLSKDDIPRVAEFGETPKDFSAVMTKRMIVSSIEIIYSIMAKIKNNSDLAKRVGTLLSMTVYRAFRLMHMSNPKNDEKMFADAATTALRNALASEIAAEAGTLREIGKISEQEEKNTENAQPEITTKFLETKYGTHAVAMMNLMRNCEKIMQKYEQI
jgi:transcriptional regulator with XRE-family HTH domain